MDNQSLLSDLVSYSTLQPVAYGLMFPGITPLLMGSMLAYQTSSPVVGVLSSLSLWNTPEVSAQGLPAVIDFNMTLMSQGLILQGGAADDVAGRSVADAGDVNGDGKNDFLIGALLVNSGGRNNAGAAYLIYGATNLPATINLGALGGLGVQLYGGAANDYAGTSVAGAEDVNGDGKSDFLVGAWNVARGGLSRVGAAYLIYGSATLPAIIDLGNLTAGLGVQLLGGGEGDETGRSVASAGDVNGDGKSDFLVGAYLATPAGRANAGIAYLIYGAASLPSTIDLANLASGLGVTLQGGAGGNFAGFSVASAGDVNGDSKSDFLVGAYAASPGGRGQAGTTYLIYGAANLPSMINLGNLTSTQGVQLHGNAVQDLSGSSVASAGDVNGDSKSDFLITAPNADPVGRGEAGIAYLIYGAANLPTTINLGTLGTRGVTLEGGRVNDGAGTSVAGAGDVNGDGKSDFLVGASGVDPDARINAGAVYLIYGAASLPTGINLGSLRTSQGVVLQGGAAGDGAGYSVASAGDVNGDRVADIMIGVYQASPSGRTNAGVAYLVYGLSSSNLTSTGSISTSLTTPSGTMPSSIALTTTATVTSIPTTTVTKTTPKPISTMTTSTAATSRTSTTPRTTPLAASQSSTGSSLTTALLSSGITPQNTRSTQSGITTISSSNPSIVTTLDSSSDTNKLNAIPSVSMNFPATPMGSIAPSSSSSVTNFAPIIAATVGGLSLAACLVGIGIYGYRKKSRAERYNHSEYAEAGTTLQDQKPSNYQQIPAATPPNEYAALTPNNPALDNSHYLSNLPPMPTDPYAGFKFTTLGGLNREIQEHKAKQELPRQNYDDISVISNNNAINPNSSDYLAGAEAMARATSAAEISKRKATQ